MDGASVIGALRGGRPVIGTLIISPSPHWTRAVAALGLDFVFIDTEHIALDRAQLAWMCQAYHSVGVAPIVRIPSPDPYQATAVLDGGARGIIVPYVETAKQVRELAGAVKLKPVKGKVLHDALFNAMTLPTALETYISELNSGNALIVNIESRPALSALDEILEIEELDAVLVGPHDLSCSLGVPEMYDHPEFLGAVAEIIQKTRAAGKGVGVHAIHQTLIRHELDWIEGGANLIVHSSDLTTFMSAMRDEIALVREALGPSVLSTARLESLNV